jgi:hypothetical protein
MTKTTVYLAFAASLSAQQILPEPKPVENMRKFEDVPAMKVSMPLPPQPAKPVGPALLEPRAAADSVSEDELKSIVETLRQTYVRPTELEEPALARARLQGLLSRLGNGARIFAGASAAETEKQPFRAEMLPDGVAYIRLGNIGPEAAAGLDVTLSSYAKPPRSLVLDLRASPPNSEFEQAAEVCRRFCPKGRILFTVKRTRANDEEILTSRMDPKWRGNLVVLVDSDTAGSGEIIAAVLRTHVGAYIIGQRTKGEAAQFEEVPLEKGRVLKVAVGEVTLPDATQVFPGGLMPDLVVDVPQEKTDEILFVAQQEKEIASLIVDKERPRMNEAALVAGTNPEMDAAQENQRKKAAGESVKPPLRDTVLQRALDFITAVGIADSIEKK